MTINFSSVLARFFRISFVPAVASAPIGILRPQVSKNVRLSRIVFHCSARVNCFESKAGFSPLIAPGAAMAAKVQPEDIVHADQVVALTNAMRSNGTLDWDPPPGHWTVLRIGYSLTGKKNGPAEKSATNLEVDKLDADMVRQYMEHYLALYSEASGGKLGFSQIQNLLTDSWEAGVQNWTPLMLSQFRTRRGYDLTRYAPVLAGWIVNDPVASDRFLWDFRRTLKEMLADNHYGTIAKVLHEHKMGYYTEAEGDTPRSIGDGMSIKARSDIPTGEFWYRPFATEEGQPPLKADLEEAASVAHLYGKPLAASESLTVAATSDPWAFPPAMLKPVVDEIFAHGINRILLHESHHQPFANRPPGLQLAFFGQFFNRNDTWADEAKSGWTTLRGPHTCFSKEGTSQM